MYFCIIVHLDLNLYNIKGGWKNKRWLVDVECRANSSNATYGFITIYN